MTTDNTLFVGLDLDYTAFATDKFFYEAVVPLLARTYPDLIQAESFIADMAKFRVTHGPAVSYNLFDQTSQLGLDIDEVERLILDDLGSSDAYLLPGVKEFVALQRQKNHDLQLISIGGDRFQKLKVACSPALAGLDLHVIMEPKGAFIAQTFAHRRGFMIDDTILHGLPETILPLYVRTGKNQDLPDTAFATIADLLAHGPIELVG